VVKPIRDIIGLVDEPAPPDRTPEPARRAFRSPPEFEATLTRSPWSRRPVRWAGWLSIIVGGRRSDLNNIEAQAAMLQDASARDICPRALNSAIARVDNASKDIGEPHAEMEPGIMQSHPANAVVSEMPNIIDGAIIGSPGSCEIEWLRPLAPGYVARQQKRNEEKNAR
jgi:hypothetical protein